jgi:hypothetical protein
MTPSANGMHAASSPSSARKTKHGDPGSLDPGSLDDRHRHATDQTGQDDTRLLDTYRLCLQADTLVQAPFGVVYAAGYLVRCSPKGLPFEYPPAVNFFSAMLPAVGGAPQPVPEISQIQRDALQAAARTSPIALCARRIWLFAAFAARIARVAPVGHRAALAALFDRATAGD